MVMSGLLANAASSPGGASMNYGTFVTANTSSGAVLPAVRQPKIKLLVGCQFGHLLCFDIMYH